VFTIRNRRGEIDVTNRVSLCTNRVYEDVFAGKCRTQEILRNEHKIVFGEAKNKYLRNVEECVMIKFKQTYYILAFCYIRFTLNICSFVHQCNIHFLLFIIRLHVSSSHGHLQVL
jgi:hypothetical protein